MDITSINLNAPNFVPKKYISVQGIDGYWHHCEDSDFNRVDNVKIYCYKPCDGKRKANSDGITDIAFSADGDVYIGEKAITEINE